MTAETITKAYLETGYDAVAVSASDLSAGKDFFLRTKDNHFPWISANIFTGDEKLFFAPYITREVDNLTIAIIGMTGKDSLYNSEFTVKNWKDVLFEQVEVLKKKAGMIILLSNLPFSDNRIIARTVPEIDIIISADRKRGNFAPQVFGNCLLTQVKGRGKYIGKLVLKFGPESRWENDYSLMITSLKKRISAVDLQINELVNKRNLLSEDLFARKHTQLQKRKKDLNQKFSILEKERLDNPSANQFKGLLLPIRPESGGSAIIDKMISELKEKIEEYLKGNRG
ncbi:hypothetical protein [Desulfomarina sp.]